MLKENMIMLLTRFVRYLLTGGTRFSFGRSKDFIAPDLREGGVYIHVPFCANLCPYCPYYKIPYRQDLAEAYTDAVVREIGHYSDLLPGLSVTSVYFGGGTPTVHMPGLVRIAEALSEKFAIRGPLCIETNPANLDRDKIDTIKSLNFHSLSLGIQSFNQKYLSLTGRRYGARKIEEVLGMIREKGFVNINVDLMFALPGQTLDELTDDLSRALRAGVDQITAYPLFTFPYTSVGRCRKVRAIGMPRFSMRRRMFYHLHDYLRNAGYERVSVWSFKKPSPSPLYSSVTRDRYVGFGPSAASYYGSLFTLNTFSVREYVKSTTEKGQAVALKMPFNSNLGVLHDLYWKLYRTVIPKIADEVTGKSRDRTGNHLRGMAHVARILGWMKDTGDSFALTKEGAFWIHLIQNQFFLRYVNAIWSKALSDPWPEEIAF